MVMLVFLGSIVAFVLIVIFLYWYTMWVSEKIFGKMYQRLRMIVDEGIVPPEWDQKLIKAIGRCRGEADKKKALEKHMEFLDGNFRNLRAYAEKTAFIQDDNARNGVLRTLDHFQGEYIEDLAEKVGL